MFSRYKIPKVVFNHTCLAVFSLDSALKKRRKLLFISVFKRNVIRHITKEIESFSSDSDDIIFSIKMNLNFSFSNIVILYTILIF